MPDSFFVNYTTISSAVYGILWFFRRKTEGFFKKPLRSVAEQAPFFAHFRKESLHFKNPSAIIKNSGLWAVSSVWLERLLDKQEAVGSSPILPTINTNDACTGIIFLFCRKYCFAESTISPISQGKYREIRRYTRHLRIIIRVLITQLFYYLQPVELWLKPLPAKAWPECSFVKLWPHPILG